jgi:hypothetical protein
MPSSLFRGLGETGAPRSAHGFAADAQVESNSDFGHQGIRQQEYSALSRQVSGLISTLKSLGARFDTLAGSGGFDDSTAIGQANACIKKARGSVNKAEMADEDGENEDAAAACDSASKLLARAAKLLSTAQEDAETDSDESAVEKAQASYLRVKKSLADLRKAKPATTAALKADAASTVSTQTVAALDKQCDVLKSQLSDVIGMLSNTSRSAGMPPPTRGQLGLMKSDGGPTIPTNTQIAEAGLTTTDAIQAKMLRNLLQQGATKEFKERISKSSTDDVRTLFTDFI